MKITTVSAKSYVNPSKIPGADWVINPYVGCPHKCLYCYAEYMRKFTAHTEPWGDFLDVKICTQPLPPAQLFHQHVLLSSVTDAYNPFEKKYQLTRRILEQLAGCEAYVSVLTKSALVVRDIDLLKQLPNCEVGFSFSTADETIRRLIEPGASSVQERLEALKAVHQAGIATAVMAAPLLPGISDFRAIVQAAAPYTRVFRFDSLNIRSTFQQKLMDFIDIHYHPLLPLYNEIYLQGKRTYWQKLEKEIKTFCTAQGLNAEILFGEKSSFSFATPPQKSPIKPRKNPLFPPEPQLFDPE